MKSEDYGWQVLAEYNSAGTLQKRFVYGNYIDEPLVMNTGGNDYYYAQDHLYSSAALLDSSGSVVERYEYDAYGRPYIMDSSYNSKSAGDYNNPYLFTGRSVDFLDNGNLELIYYRTRYYSPAIGRFLSHDQLGIDPAERIYNPFAPSEQFTDGGNLYLYGFGDPVNISDALGLWGEDVHMHRSRRWAADEKLCFASDVGTWANKPDTDWRRTPVFGVVAATASIISNNPLVGFRHLRTIAYWHFPGADAGMPVEPESSYAIREVTTGIEKCNLQVFSEGLHQLQDSFAHQSGGRLPPYLGYTGHSRDRYGWYWEYENDPAIEQGQSESIMRLKRRVNVIRSHDADIVSIFYTDLLGTEKATKDYIRRFKSECECIKEGQYKGKNSHCP